MVDDIDTTVNLSVPADPGSISVVRALVASVASKLDLPYDAVDDLRIAAAEAAALLLSGAEGARLCVDLDPDEAGLRLTDRKSTRLNSSHGYISYAVFCLKKKK